MNETKFNDSPFIGCWGINENLNIHLAREKVSKLQRVIGVQPLGTMNVREFFANKHNILKYFNLKYKKTDLWEERGKVSELAMLLYRRV